MKTQWLTMSADQESRFTLFRDKKSIVGKYDLKYSICIIYIQEMFLNCCVNILLEKDVNRTDRTIPFYAGTDNPNLRLLSDVLMTYVMYNFDLGYVQGMSDLLSPILAVLGDEVESFWCFVGFMRLMVSI